MRYLRPLMLKTTLPPPRMEAELYIALTSCGVLHFAFSTSALQELTGVETSECCRLKSSSLFLPTSCTGDGSYMRLFSQIGNILARMKTLSNPALFSYLSPIMVDDDLVAGPNGVGKQARAVTAGIMPIQGSNPHVIRG